MIDSLKKQLVPIEESLHQTKAKSGQDVLNFPIRLDDKLANIYNIAAAGNGEPALQVLSAYDEVSRQIDTELQKLNTIKSTGLAEINDYIRKNNLPVFMVKEKE